MRDWRDGLAGVRGDLRHTLRGLRRAPGFTAAVVLSLALGVGAATTVFTFADAILIRPLPYPEADRLVALGHEAPGVGVLQAEQSDGTYLHYRSNSRVFVEIATYYENVVNLSGADGQRPERVRVAMVSTTLFPLLGARTVIGGLPAGDEADPGRSDDPYAGGAAEGGVDVLLSHDLWERRYGADPDIVGSIIEANRAPRRVIGVLEAGFDFPHPDIGIWYPEDPDPATARAVDMYKLGIGRLRPGFTPEDAARDLDRLIPALSDAYPDLTPELVRQARLRAVVTPLKDRLVGDASRSLWLLLGGMAFLLLIACANVANLLLARAEHRRRDMAVRAALGAGGVHVTQLFAAEGVILAALGGGLGLLGAVGAVEALVALVPPDSLPRLHEVRLDGRVVAFAAALALGVALVLVAVLALRRSTTGISSVLKDGGSPMTPGRGRQRAQRTLVTGQVALALTLLVGAALMVQSFQRLARADPGFDAAGVLTAEIAMPYRGYETYGNAQRFWSELIERVEALAGVESAGAVSGVPLVPRPVFYDLAIDVEEQPGEPFSGVTVYDVTPGYLRAMGIPVLEGEEIDARGASVERPVLLSAAAARRLSPGREAIGRRVRRAVGPGLWLTVIGVVADVPAERIGGEAAEIVYVPVLETAVDRGRIPRQGTLVVRAAVPPLSLAPAVRAIVRELDQNLPVANVRTMEEIVSGSMARTSFTMILLLVAATAALLLGIVGVYGVTSYAVGRRTQEIGLRVALGARPADVERMVLGDGARLVLGGIALGTLAALGLARFMGALLYDVRPSDPITYAATALLLLGTALLAAWLPARRGARVDPTEALRCR